MHTATVDTEISTAVTPATFASLGSRFVAQIVDALAMFGVFFVLGSFFAMLFGGATESGFEFTGFAGGLFIAVEIVLVLGYFVISEARWGATLGKLAAGIRVQSTNGQGIGYAAALVRNLMRVVDMLPAFYLTGVISILVTRRNQRLGDLVADSVVVRPQAGRGLRLAGLALAVALCVGGYLLGMRLAIQPDIERRVNMSRAASADVAPDPTTDTASGSAMVEDAAATPWSSRGWVQREGDTYVNPEHNLQLVVPDGWTIFDEGSRDPQFLWLMGKLEPDGKQRMFMGLFAEDMQGMSDEEWFDAQFQFIRDATLTIGDQTRPAFEILRTGETQQPGVYQIRFTRIDNGMRGHQLFFVRDGLGYTVTRNASADASTEEIADLEQIRQSMDLR